MSRALLDPAARGAIEWMARLQSGEVSETDHRRFEAWRSGDTRHAAAWSRLESVRQTIRAPLASGMSPQQVQALLPPPPAAVNRRTALGAALLFGGVALTAAVVDRSIPLADLTADLGTRTGERRSVALGGGGKLVLNARSAVDLGVVDGHDVLRLRNGLIHIDTAPAGAEITLQAVAGSVTLDDGACNLSLDEGVCRIDVTRGSARFAGPRSVLLLDEGDSLTLGQNGLRRFTTDRSAALSWLEGQLVVHDEPLSHVVRMLRPYWRGVLRLDEQVAELRVTGAFPLAETWASLRSLAVTLPIRVDRRAGYWIRIAGAT